MVSNSDGSEKERYRKFENGVGDAKIDIELNEKDTKAKENEDKDDNEEKKEDELTPVPFFQLFRYATKFEKSLMFGGVVAAMVSGVCTPLMFILFGNVTDAFVYNAMLESITNETLGNITEMYPNITVQYPEFENATTVEEVRDILKEIFDIGDFFHEVVIFGSGTIGIGALQMLCGYIFVAALNYAAEGQVYRLRGTFLESILRQEIGYFDTRQTNDFASKVTENLNKLQDGIGEKVGMFVFYMTIFVASIIIAFIHGWLLTLVILSVFPLIGISIGILTQVQVKLTAAEVKAYAKAGSIAEQTISSIRTVFAFGGEAKELDKYNNNLEDAKKAGVKRGFVTGAGMGFLYFFIFGAYALAFYYGTKLILDSRPPNGDGSFDPSNLIIVFFSVLMGAMNVGQSAPYVEAFSIARGSAAAIYDIIERKSAIDPTSTAGKKLSSINGTIELKDVHFNYPSRPDVQILKGATVRVEPGQTVALVGASGCGKSTCIQLIQRFYDPLSGSVQLDGEDIRNLNIGWLRDQIGIVGQEPVLFATTIAENIRYGHPSATMEDIEMAAKEANAHDFIMKLPKKYETNVGERGAQISGGQKQRIAIARALVKQPRFLLLDEATSALDNQSEAIVQKALDKVRLGRSTVIVAHRLTTIRTADKIVVFNKGQVEEEGTHAELMKLQNLYYNLVTAQIGPLALQKQNSIQDSSPANDDENARLDELAQDIMDDVTNMSPASLAHSPSIRESLRRRSRRRASSVKSVKSEIKEEEEDYEPISMLNILKWNSKEWPLIVGGVFCAAVQGATMPLYAILFGEVFGTMSIVDEDEARKEANFYSLMFLTIGIVVALATFLQAYLFSLSGSILTTRLRKLSFAAMLKQEAGWYDDEENSVGAVCSRLSEDAAAVQGATGSRIGTILQSIVTLGLSVALALYYDWRLGLVTFPFIPIVLVAVYFQGKLLMGQSITQNKVLRDAGKIAIEAITNIRTVASLHKEVYFAAEYSRALLKPHKLALKQSHLRGITFGFAAAVPLFAFSCVMFYGGSLVNTEGIDYETVFKVAEILIMGTMTVGQAVAFAPNFTKAKVSASKIFALLHRRPVIDSSAGVGLRLSGSVEKVELQGVHFSYPTRPNITVLNGLSVQVDKGQTLALVGSSGCGKSTIIGLLERFYDARKGQVCINGQDVQGLNVGCVRSQLGLVSQEPVLFDLSIAENISYGDNSRTVGEEEIVSAAKQANIHEFVKSLPDQYETRVGSKGTQLSGGQKQRIAIARAMIRNPGVLLLDEATSALDAESEKVVQKALERVQEGRTSIVIAHRLSTIQGADIIAVVQGGCVVESGTHSELILKKGHYYNLYKTNQ